MNLFGKAYVVCSHGPSNAKCIADIAYGKDAPNTGIIKAGVMIGDGYQGYALWSLDHCFHQTLLVVHSSFIHYNCERGESKEYSNYS